MLMFILDKLTGHQRTKIKRAWTTKGMKDTKKKGMKSLFLLFFWF